MSGAYETVGVSTLWQGEIPTRNPQTVELKRSVNGRIGGDRNAQCPPKFHNASRQPVEFEAIATLEIVQHRGLHAVWYRGRIIEAVLGEIGRERDPLGAADGADRIQTLTEKPARVVIGEHIADRLARERRCPGQA